MKQRKSKISDRELDGLLSSLREDVAAPADFRAQLIKRVAMQQGLGQTPPSLAERAVSWLTAARLVPALAALGLLAFGAWFAIQSGSPAQPKGEASVKMAGVPASKPKSSAPVLAQQGAPQVEESQIQSQAPAAQGSDSNPRPQTRTSGAQISPEPKDSPPASAFGGGAILPGSHPTAVASPEPLLRPLPGNSQVRGNKILAREKKYAAVLFQLKQGGHVRIEVWDRGGRLRAVPLDGERPAGLGELDWYGLDDSGKLLPSAIYLIRVKSGEFDERHKVVLVH
jgi:hypothetical protein